MDEKRWRALAAELIKIDPKARVCGAEINTVDEARRSEELSLEHLVFTVSDTEAGRNTGEILKHYFEQRRDLKLRTVGYETVKDLQDQDPQRFRVNGLRNLVRNIGGAVTRTGGPAFAAIDATGGHKAQIALAVLIGQVLDIPVFYKHERFGTMIDFPPMPISFDYQVLARNADVLAALERGRTLTAEEVREFEEKLRVLLTEVQVDGTTLCSLDPIGEIYLTGFRLRYARAIRLPAAMQRSQPSLRPDHYPIEFREFVTKVWEENDWVRSIRSLPYGRQGAIRGIGFLVRDDGEGPRLIGTFQDKNNFGARFWVQIGDDALDTLTFAADRLNQTYGG